MAHAGLLGGNYLRFNDEIHINISELYRAAAQANLWLGEEYRQGAAGPAVVERARLGVQVVAMGNLLRGFARASGRGYTEEEVRMWKVIVKGLFEVIKRWDGRTMDAMVFPALMREEMRDLGRRGLIGESFFEGDVQPNSLRADLDMLLQYLAVKTVEAYTAREALRTTTRPEPSVLHTVSSWIKNLRR
ncbi:hypothetical protein M409DRAFT_30813 [Zasmidium cellare ATCC 36951]|uniref:Uncharacterized protein n=1 Tax=Zasmidium cellare ATCC 36951 TaxID=1080233 RepID=A0A6A6BXF2_ZASCE|nr:uncharacterized protein M409DRAFT_30813 [Zasmidium cellare ATCC 36951]KAF2158718.1 hypothetical protein M409DRAFT_30813 [Zasmidium cellare ATCC 36951]